MKDNVFAAVRQPRMRIRKDRSGQWRWKIVASNSRIVCVAGESFTRAADAMRAFKSARRAMAAAVTRGAKG